MVGNVFKLNSSLVTVSPGSGLILGWCSAASCLTETNDDRRWSRAWRGLQEQDQWRERIKGTEKQALLLPLYPDVPPKTPSLSSDEVIRVRPGYQTHHRHFQTGRPSSPPALIHIRSSQTADWHTSVRSFTSYSSLFSINVQFCCFNNNTGYCLYFNVLKILFYFCFKQNLSSNFVMHLKIVGLFVCLPDVSETFHCTHLVIQVFTPALSLPFMINT